MNSVKNLTSTQIRPLENIREYNMNPKPVAASSITIVQQMMDSDANLAGNVHGGCIMKLVDNTAGMVAMRHSGGNAVTASLDRLDFHSPVYIGNILRIRASVNYVGTTSMEIGARVEAEDVLTGEVRHTASAYLTFVALDQEHKPRRLPPLICETELQQERFEAAAERKKARAEAVKAARQREEERRQRNTPSA